MGRVLIQLAALAALGSLTAAASFGQAPSVELAAVTAAAQALGGVERIQSVRNITLEGYGQYVYMFGGGNITGDPGAPMKYQAANDLKRVYDLENGRFQQRERRNFLFPSLGSGVMLIRRST